MDHDGPWWTMVILSLDLNAEASTGASVLRPCVKAAMCWSKLSSHSVELFWPVSFFQKSFTILHHLSALFTFVLVVWGLTVGAFTVFLVRPDATRQNDSAFQCAGLACQVGQVGIKVLDLVAKWALPCEPVCQVWQVKIFLLRPWVPSKVTASILLADPFGLSFCGSQAKNHVICPSKVCSRESESAWTLFVLPLFRRSTSCCDVMSRNLRGCEMSSRLYIGCIRVVAFCSSNSQKIKDCYSIATIAGWKKIKNILKISWKMLTLRDRDAESAWCRVRQET